MTAPLPPSVPAASTDVQAQSPIERAEARLAGLDDLPLEEHVAAFTDIDSHLRQALQPPGGGGG